MPEVADKIHRVRELASKHHLEAILLQRVSSIAWITCGAAAYVNSASSKGEASLLVTQDRQVLFTNNIEAARLEKEEGLAAQGWDLRVTPWYEKNTALQELTRGMKLGSDGLALEVPDLADEIAHLRADLTAEEGERFRLLGNSCAQAMMSAARCVRPGMTENEIAGLLAGAARQRGVQAIVNLIATDERISEFRHPLPTAKKLVRYAMLVLCGRRQGLVCSITRLIHFGPLPEETRHKAEAVARIDAGMIANTLPGVALKAIFQGAVDNYAAEGFPEEWRLHHQGGTAGYEPREYVATPGSIETVSAGQVYAWNPSITGAKSEDTILVGETRNEVLTAIPGWPVLKVDPGIAGNPPVERPAILVIDRSIEIENNLVACLRWPPPV